MRDELERLTIPLLEWYRENARDLPWRRSPTPYHVWVSEIMLQQTRVAAVLGYYERFLEAFPDVPALAAAPADALMKRWEGLGYYSRARNLQRAAQVMTQRYGGEFPRDYDAIRALPGVGDYTAGAVASIAFGLPRAAVDGNVLRVTARLTADPSDISRPATRRAVTQALEEVIPLDAPGAFNQALMELGATVCLPNGAPACGRCPVRELCAARRLGRTGDLPVRGRRPPRRLEERDVYLIFFEGRVALRRRAPGGLLEGLWEYPGVPRGEAPPLPVEDPVFVGTGRHIFTHVEWHMNAYRAQALSSALPPGWVWATGEELRLSRPLPSAFAPFREAVERELGRPPSES